MAESSIKEKLENNLDNSGLGLYDNSILSAQFCCELKTALKNVFLKKGKNVYSIKVNGHVSR